MIERLKLLKRLILTNSCFLPGDLVVLQVGPQLELMLPLVHRHAVGDQAQHALLDARGRSDAHQRLTGPTGQHDNPCIRHDSMSAIM